MKHIKDGVTLAPDTGLEIIDALIEAAVVYNRFGYPLVITSLGDGEHSEHSLHYTGRAADLRTRHVKQQDLAPLTRELKVSLGHEYDVVLEGDHIHLEYDPKA